MNERNEVRRYSDLGYGGGCHEDRHGAYVKYEDCVELLCDMEERLTAMEVMIEAAKSAGCTFVQKSPYTENHVECLVYDAERDRLQMEVQCMQATIDALTRKATELQDELENATCDKERCINCGDRLDAKDGHCENCTARALRWDELTRTHEATP